MTGWRDQAACRGEDPELFFPASPRNKAARKARAICAGCPVRLDCTRDAEEKSDWEGIRGGLTGTERRRLFRRDLDAGQLAEVLRSTGARHVPAPPQLSPAVPVTGASEVVPPDPDAAAHREVLLRELRIFERAFSGEDRLAPRREQVFLAAAVDVDVLRLARNEAERCRTAGSPIPASTGLLEREFWRRRGITERQRKGTSYAA